VLVVEGEANHGRVWSETKEEAMIQTTGGIVKDGVIVSDRPLPENAYVEIVVPNAPREIVDRVRWREASKLDVTKSFSPSGRPRVLMDADIPDCLRYHGAEQVFAGLVEHIRSCFPEA
jgi:hypothetical protein